MASTSTIALNVFNADRNPWVGPEVKIELSNPFINTSDKKVRTKIPKGKSNLILTNIKADAGQVYMLLVGADKHRDQIVFPVKPVADVVTAINIMLIPNNPVPDFSGFSYNELKSRSPQFHSALSESISEKDLLGLPNVDKDFGAVRLAAFLNIEAKLRATVLKVGHATDYIQLFKSLDGLERDRIKVEVGADMPKNVKGSKAFTELNPDLNEMNHKGFPVSFKEKVAFCSLQLSFAKKAEGGMLAADVDIDLLTDIGHFGEVIRNKVTKMKTDPFTVYGLLFDQGIRPLYTLKV